MNIRSAVLAAAAILPVPNATSAQEKCKSPPLTRQQVLEFVRKDALDRGTAWSLDKWNLQISEEKCNYRVLADCCPEQRGMDWSLLISREGKVLERFYGR